MKAREPDEDAIEGALGGGAGAHESDPVATAASGDAARGPTSDARTDRAADSNANFKIDAKNDTKDGPNGNVDASPEDSANSADKNDTPRTRGGAPRSAGTSPPNSWRYRTNPSVFAPHAGETPDTSALNKQIVQAVSFANAETASYAASQIAIDADMVISQSAALASQSALSYFDGVSKLALASQAVLIKEMTQSLAKGAAGAQDALVQGLGVLATDIMVAAAAAVAAATGAMEGEAAGFAMDKIDQSISKYAELLDRSKSVGGG